MGENSGKSWSLVYRPREWQLRAFELWNAARRGVVRVVTGGGKTVFAEMCMASFRQQNPDAIFIILVPTLTLLDQWFVALQEELTVPTEEIACFSSQDKGAKPKRVNLIVINSARTLVARIADGKEVMLIVDECHRAGSPVNSSALSIQAKASLGLSATPERESDDGFESRVSPALGGIIFRYDYADAHRDGVISPFELINIRVDLLPDEERRYRELSRKAALEIRNIKAIGGSDDKLKRILLRRAAVAACAAMRVPVAAKLVEMNRGRRTIVFHERLTATDSILRMINARRHCGTAYHSGIGPALRRDNLRLYRRGAFDVLVTCRALDEGMNAPETTIAIIASSTSSERQRIQRLGRVLRPAPGKSFATIYTLYATDLEERRLREEEASLTGVARVSWQKGGARRDA